MTEEETTALPALFDPPTPPGDGIIFDVVRRGYDREQVDSAVHALRARVDELEERLATLDGVLTRNRAELDQANTSLARGGRPTFDALGERIGSMLALAEEEAAQMRADAAADTQQERAAATEEAARVRKQAERDAFEVAETTRSRVSELERREGEMLRRLAAVRDTISELTEGSNGSAT